MAVFDDVVDVVVEQLSVPKENVKIPDSDAEKLKTIADVVTFVEGLKK